MKQLNHEIIQTLKARGNLEPERVAVKVNDTIFMCPTEVFKDFIIDCSESHWNKVEDWVNNKLIPYMTRKTINYKTSNSYGLKHTCEKEIDEYTANIQIMYILALRAIKTGKINNLQLYQTDFYYPLSSKFNKVRERPMYRPKFRIR